MKLNAYEKRKVLFSELPAKNVNIDLKMIPHILRVSTNLK